MLSVAIIILLGANFNLISCENKLAQQNFTGNFISQLWKDLFSLDPEVFMNASEIIAYHGYQTETHIVVTVDGYILEIQRISNGRTRQRSPIKLPVVIVHGTGADAFSWVMNLPNETFAFVLADEGYDVWLPNLRGTVSSQKHVSLDPTKSEFWKFTMDEMANYDVPVIIDHILNTTGHSQLIYSGHSLGGAIIYTVKAIFAMAPIGNFANAGPLLKLGGFAEPVLMKAASSLGIYSTASSSYGNPRISGLFAKYFGYGYVQLYFLVLFGQPDMHIDPKRIPIYVNHVNGTTSMHVLSHEGQIITSNKFQHYDWGKETNLVKYKQEIPPEYNISQIDVPSYLFYGDIDTICSEENVQFLKNHLGNVVVMKEFGKNWNHFDYIISRDAGLRLYNEFKKLIKNET